MEKKRKSERDKYREIFAQVFKTSPDQEEIKELSRPARKVVQKMVDQKVVHQNLVDQNLVDQKMVDQKVGYPQIIDAIISSPFTPITKFALTVFMLKNAALEFTISINKAAQMLRVSRTTVINMINELKKWNMIVKQGQNGTTISLYTLLGRPKSGLPKSGRPETGRPLEEEEEDNSKYIPPLPPQVVDQNLVDQNLNPLFIKPFPRLILKANGLELKKLDPATLNALSWLYQQNEQDFALVCYASRKANINIKGFIRKTIREKRYEDLSIEDRNKALQILEAAKRFMVAVKEGISTWLKQVGDEQAAKDLYLLLGRPVVKHQVAYEAEKLKNSLGFS